MDNRCCANPSRKVWLPVVACLLSLAPYLPLLSPDDRVLDAEDYQAYQLPTRQFARQEMLNGRFPLWMPSLGAGTPLHAGQQAALTYPPLLPFLLLPSVNFGLRLCLFAHLLAGYWGQYLLGRRFALSSAAAALSATVTTLSGFAIGHLLAGHLNLIFGLALFPWLFLALSHFLARPGPLTAAGVTLCVALLLLTGQPQLPYYALLFGTGLGLASLVGGVAAAHRGRTIGWTLAAGVVALLIVSIQWLPTTELVADGRAFSPRGQGDFFDIAALRPPELLILAVPNATGNPYANVPMFMGSGWRFHEKACYLGLLPLGLAAYGFTRRRVAAWQWAFLFVCGLTFIVALGNSTPITGWLTRIVPGLGLFRAPARILSLTSLLVALLAGRGLDDWLDAMPRAGRSRQILLAAVAVVLCLGIGASCFILRDIVGKYATYALTVVKEEFTIAALLALVSVAVFLLAARLAPRHRVAAQLLVLLTLTVDLWVSQARHVHLVEPTAGPGANAPSQATLRFAPLANTEAAFRYSGAIGVLSVRPWGTIATNDGGILPASLERLKAGYLDPDQRETILRQAACDYRYDSDNHRWQQVSDTLPRVRLGLTREEAPAGDATVLAETPQDMTVRVRTETPTTLIVADCYYPGWQAEVDGRPQQVEAANGIFRGVAVPDGDHEVRFRYISWPFRAGLAASVLGWVLFGGFIVLGVRQRWSVVQLSADAVAPSHRFAAA